MRNVLHAVRGGVHLEADHRGREAHAEEDQAPWARGSKEAILGTMINRRNVHADRMKFKNGGVFEDAPRAASILSVTESKPGEGTKCDRPNREAFAAAAKRGGPIDERDLPQCGAPAVVLEVITYENMEPTRWNCCEECRPRKAPDGHRKKPVPPAPTKLAPTGAQQGPLHHEWSAGPEQPKVFFVGSPRPGFEIVVGHPRTGHRTVLDRAGAEQLHKMLGTWLAEETRMVALTANLDQRFQAELDRRGERICGECDSAGCDRCGHTGVLDKDGKPSTSGPITIPR